MLCSPWIIFMAFKYLCSFCLISVTFFLLSSLLPLHLGAVPFFSPAAPVETVKYAHNPLSGHIWLELRCIVTKNQLWLLSGAVKLGARKRSQPSDGRNHGMWGSQTVWTCVSHYVEKQNWHPLEREKGKEGERKREVERESAWERKVVLSRFWSLSLVIPTAQLLLCHPYSLFVLPFHDLCNAIASLYSLC